ncbi:universal stress protein [Microbispora sp. RL4-1S]|uniref:Universal stress protein n=1 Tax=Microbispora oryzae TaxID=2806554 RepID=A0A940WEE9_9ACTN|nr:universal stress protein [Microbispora oryzae]MBP2704089.1 universal stress protein [Microbispora oryzae]
MNQPKIVVGINGSIASQAALRWAAAEGALRGARVEAVYAWEWTSGLHAYYAPLSKRTSREDERRAAMDVAERAVRELGGGDVAPVVVEGPPAQVLLRATDDAELLVLGTREAEGEPYPVINPVVSACLLRAHCPVVVVLPGMTHGRPLEGAFAGSRA